MARISFSYLTENVKKVRIFKCPRKDKFRGNYVRLTSTLSQK